MAGSYGPASLQAEYQLTSVERDHGLGSLDFNGWYAQAAYTLTGEARPYNATKGYFDGIRPAHNFDANGWGAFDLALRLSSLDLTDGTVNGGRERNATAAFNWYLNQYLKLSANVVKVLDVTGGPFNGEEPTVYQARMQFAY